MKPSSHHSTPNFGHSPAQIAFWRKLARPLLSKAPTPFFLFSIAPIQAALRELDSAFSFNEPRIRHWLSFKTQPIRPLVRWWQESGRGVEVVSEFEFLAALREGFAPGQILLNGPAKHRWLVRLVASASASDRAKRFHGLSLNFDSPAEIEALLPLAAKLNWRLGVRINTSQEFDPENSEIPTQFGFQRAEAIAAITTLLRKRARLEMVHFHLRTNIQSAAIYENALREVSEICHAARFSPGIVDCGGGFPPPHVLTRDGHAVNASFSFAEAAQVYQKAPQLFPGLRELWLENGRWLSARSGVLVTKILDVKERGRFRNLICDGGRTMNAMLSTWEQHELISLENRSGPKVLTTVNGPTCMAFDQIARRPLPRSLRVGDHLLWFDAGAYHLPWETRFSHGLAAVFWHDGKATRLARPAEDFENWWNQWL